MRLLLIRHGQTDSNVGQNLDTAIPGAPLNALGRAQAEAVPAALRERGERVVAVSASPLLRTQQTAAPLARALGVEVRLDEGFREIEAGDYEMRNDADAIAGYMTTVFGWKDDPAAVMPGGVSGTDVLTRFDAAIAAAARAHADALTGAGAGSGVSAGTGSAAGDPALAVVAHGAVIRVWVGLRADNVSLDAASEHWLSNTGMVALTGDPDDPTSWHAEEWHAAPLGGTALDDRAHTGPAGEPEDEAEAEAQARVQ